MLKECNHDMRHFFLLLWLLQGAELLQGHFMKGFLWSFLLLFSARLTQTCPVPNWPGTPGKGGHLLLYFFLFCSPTCLLLIPQTYGRCFWKGHICGYGVLGMGRKRLLATKFRFGETSGFLELSPSSQNLSSGNSNNLCGTGKGIVPACS